MNSFLFPDKAAAATALRATLSMGAISTYLAGSTAAATLADDDFLYGKLLAAEADASRRLRVFFGPTEVIPDDAAQSEIDAFEAAGTHYYQEAAYDYDPDQFSLGQFPLISTMQKPVIAVRSIKLNYPGQSPGVTAWEFPLDWLRINRKYGQISIVPSATGYSPAPLAMFTLNAMSNGGLVAPCVVEIRYLAGLKNATSDYPDLVDVVKKMAVLRLLQDAMVPQSGSISADGLSESMSFDIEKMHDGVDAKIDSLREYIHGVRMVGM